MIFSYRNYFHLHWREPEGEVACDVLYQNGQKPVDRAHDCRVQHYQTLLFSFFIYAEQIKSLRHVHIKLDGSHLPLPPDGVLSHEIQLRSVKSGFTEPFKPINIFL